MSREHGTVENQCQYVIGIAENGDTKPQEFQCHLEPNHDGDHECDFQLIEIKPFRTSFGYVSWNFRED